MIWHQGQKPEGDKPAADKPAADQAQQQKPATEKPGAEKSGTEKQGAEKAGTAKPIDQAAQPQVPVLPPVPPVQVPPVAPIQQAPAPAPGGGGARIGQILEPALWLVGILLLGAFIIAMIKRSQALGNLQGDSAHDQLARFREAHDEGEMTDEEYKRVKSLLSAKIKEDEIKAAGEAGSAAAPQPGTQGGASAGGAGGDSNGRAG